MYKCLKYFLLVLIGLTVVSGVFASVQLRNNNENYDFWYFSSAIGNCSRSSAPAFTDLYYSLNSNIIIWNQKTNEQDTRIISSGLNINVGTYGTAPIIDGFFIGGTLPANNKGYSYLKYQSAEDFSSSQGMSTSSCQVQIQPLSSSNLPTLTQPFITANIQANLQSISRFPGFSSIVPGVQNVLAQHYYMKTFVMLKATKGSEVKYFFPENAMSTIVGSGLDNEGVIKTYVYNKDNYNNGDILNPNKLEKTTQQLYSYFSTEFNNVQLAISSQLIPSAARNAMSPTTKYPYVLATPISTQIRFDPNRASPNYPSINSFCGSGCDALEIIAIPIDGKCDSNNDGQLILGTDFVQPLSQTLPSYCPVLPGTTAATAGTSTNGAVVSGLDPDPAHSTVGMTQTGCQRTLQFNGQSLDLGTLATGVQKEITIIKRAADGTITSVEKQPILKEELGLHLSAMRRYPNSDRFIEALNTAFNTMTDPAMQINQTIQNDPVSVQKNRVTISIPKNSVRQGTTIYQVLPKSVLAGKQLKDIVTNVKHSSSLKYFILDKDPVIGWYFEDGSSGSGDISYDINGTPSGGVVIVTQEPILFNDGELLVNYRSTCNADEVALFELDSLANSSVYKAGSGKAYKVCVSHVKYDLTLAGNTNKLDIAKFIDGNNLSIEKSIGAELATLKGPAMDGADPLTWNILIQSENPSGDFSCLGSIDNQQSSKFGDCAYNANNRIWIKFGTDLTPPVTGFVKPVIAHSVTVELTPTDVGGSGVNETHYCVKDGTETCATLPYTKIGTQVYLNCPQAWGCTREVKFYSIDNMGNVELPKSTGDLLLLDAGSSCQSDCTAKPSPNRYLKQCQNLNGCFYYLYNDAKVYDGGTYVANQCDNLAAGSYAKFNSTHEIMCPNGPLRPARDTETQLFINGCKNIFKVPFVAIVEGLPTTLDVVYCLDSTLY